MSKKVRDYENLANDILEKVGGKENIIKATRCATRLRLVLKTVPLNAVEEITELAGVITVVQSGGQFQVVIGPHVGEVYDYFVKLIDLDTVDEADQPKTSILNRIIATMSAVFAPFVYILAAAGILQGLLIIMKLINPSLQTTGAFKVFDFISWTPFTFLPILIAITAAKHFKTNQFIALACCAALVNPSWALMAAQIASGESIKFFGISLSETTYTSTVLPASLLVWLLSYVQRFFEKILPEVIRSLFVPLFCMVIMVPLTLLIVGPLSNGAAVAIADGYNKLVEVAPPLAGALIGGFWQVAVIFGVHWGITPMCLANFEAYGRDSFQAFQTIAVIAQVGAVFGVFLKTRDKEMKKISLSAGITGLFGITEPAIYGVTLRLKRPFLIGCLAGAVGGLVASFFNTYYYAYAGLPGILTSVNALNSDNPSSFIGLMIGSAIALFGSIIAIQVFGTENKKIKTSK
ncbi:PTS beta-glucoside transporter subunit EIIBCA [Brochothrix thermosphacta]|nr:PTS beta-glucoside transporter subunit EIIBCA [Brochothrix thermosphacta]ODJ68067.1 PTS beta-glucoside transporter subunit EIIBCA [Brochothrix thermosphacta]SPN71056.1 putative PTS system, beta-glucoside-specific, IIBC component [Brochothrix thermosphacta]